MATAANPGRPKDETLPARRKTEILDAAAKLFAKHGYEGTDVDSVAARLKVGKGTVYRYFPSKKELFLAAVDRGLERMLAQIEADSASVADPLQKIETAMTSFLKFFDSDRDLVELFIQERALFKGRRQPAYFSWQQASCGPWMELTEGLMKAGRIRPMPDLQDYNVVDDLLYGTIMANHFAGRRIPYGDQAAQVIDLVFNGILSDAERARRGNKGI